MRERSKHGDAGKGINVSYSGSLQISPSGLESFQLGPFLRPHIDDLGVTY